MAARDQARRLPHHCRQGRPASAALQPSGQRSHSPFPLIVETLARLRSRSCIIDGEAVACDDNGVSSFDLIRHHRANESIFLYAFDLIELNGDDLRRDPLVVRKATLASIRPAPASDSTTISRATARPSSPMPASLAWKASCRKEGLAFTLRALARLAQDEEPRGSGGEARRGKKTGGNDLHSFRFHRGTLGRKNRPPK